MFFYRKRSFRLFAKYMGQMIMKLSIGAFCFRKYNPGRSSPTLCEGFFEMNWVFCVHCLQSRTLLSGSHQLILRATSHKFLWSLSFFISIERQCCIYFRDIPTLNFWFFLCLPFSYPFSFSIVSSFVFCNFLCKWVSTIWTVSRCFSFCDLTLLFLIPSITPLTVL